MKGRSFFRKKIEERRKRKKMREKVQAYHVSSKTLTIMDYLKGKRKRQKTKEKKFRKKLFIFLSFRVFGLLFIVIFTTFRSICPPAFFRCLSNSGTYTELRTTSFIESTGVTCSDSVRHNRVQVLSIPVLLLTCSQDWTCNLL